MPKVSALMAVYNTPEDILRQTINSILNQTFTDFELIIVDDSPDPAETGKIVRSYADPRIRYTANEKKHGHLKNVRQNGCAFNRRVSGELQS